ncbi:pro-interleukin-16-like [Scyliorhinus canicula]|uniref:pro-interleukin-16-like n=1 Tax=Scyliorhinus canicula TaxID=7830 RepID=UPI0018F2AF17|nr:pro-interleukin-16-like [Scyliorhinus canicula]
MEAKFGWPFRGSRSAESGDRSKATSSEVTAAKGKAASWAKEEQRKGRSFSVFSGKPGAGEGIGPRKHSLHEGWEGGAPQPGGHRRSASLGATQFWKAVEGGGQKAGPGDAKAGGGAGTLEGLRRRCEVLVGHHKGEVEGSGGAEARRPRAMTTGEAPGRPLSVLQKIHSFEQIVRQRCARKGSQQEVATKTPAGNSDTGKGTVGGSNERKSRSKSAPLVPHVGQAQRRGGDQGALEDDWLRVEASGDQQAPRSFRGQGHEFEDTRVDHSMDPPGGARGSGKAARNDVATDLEMVKQAAGMSEDSEIQRPPAASRGAQNPPKGPRGEPTSGREEAAGPEGTEEGLAAAGGKGQPTGSSHPEGSLGRPPGGAAARSLPSPLGPPPEAGVGPCDAGEAVEEDDRKDLEFLGRSLLRGQPGTSSPYDSWSELRSLSDKASLFPGIKSDDECSLSDESVMTSHSDIGQLDKSYSISLAELRDCGLDCREDVRRSERLNHSASLNSNMSYMSVVSLIPNDELERLLAEVKCLDEETVQCAEEIQVVVLHKEDGSGLGFSIAGGSDHENKMITVHKVFPSGLAAQEGTIAQGDEVLSINGNSLRGLTHSGALSLLHKARPGHQAIVVIRKSTEAERAAVRVKGLSNKTPRDSVDHGAVPVSSGDMVTVELMKTFSGLGFSLDGGKSSSQGDRPLTIKKVFQGGSADQSGLLQPGDQLMQVGEEDYCNLTCYEAWNLIKAIPPGLVRVVIRKSQLGAQGQQT